MPQPVVRIPGLMVHSPFRNDSLTSNGVAKDTGVRA
jgi:hypothetical protein